MTSDFHTPRRQLLAEAGRYARFSSGQAWQTGDNPPTELSWKDYFLPNFPPPLLFVLISNEKHCVAFR